jgi:hypothetical protein
MRASIVPMTDNDSSTVQGQELDISRVGEPAKPREWGLEEASRVRELSRLFLLCLASGTINLLVSDALCSAKSPKLTPGFGDSPKPKLWSLLWTGSECIYVYFKSRQG